MSREEIIEILVEMQKWRRGEHPYDEVRDMPYSSVEFGIAIDGAIELLREGL